MKKLMSVTLFAVGLSGHAAVAQASGGPDHGPGRHFDARVEHIADLLQIEGPQRERLRAVADAHRARARNLRDAMRANRRALRRLDPGAPDYATELDQLADEHGRISAEQVRLGAEFRQAISGALSSEQRAQLASQAPERKLRRPPPGG